MNNPLDRRLLWISFLLHVGGIFFISFFNQDAHIRKSFVAYGAHSKKITHAYFRRLKKGSSYKNYLSKQRAKEKVRLAKRRKARFVRQAKEKKQARLAREAKQAELAREAQKKLAAKKVAKNVVKKKQEKKRLVKKEKSKEKQEEQKQEDDAKLEALDEDDEEILYFNLMGETDSRVMIYQQCIQVEVDRLWRPPIGATKGTECEVLFTIGRDGSVKEFKIQKSSKMLIYDLSIVRVSKEFNFDRCLWGKSFVVTFRQ